MNKTEEWFKLATNAHAPDMPRGTLVRVGRAGYKPGELHVCVTLKGEIITAYVWKVDGDYYLLSRRHPPLYYKHLQSIRRVLEIVLPEKKGRDNKGRDKRLKQLRDRLDRLDKDDITNCSTQFKLEKQIYDLEHEPDAEEWPDVIDA